ncbi:DUF2934 domain-containing protein [Rhizobium sp. CFBP 13726]|uniref:DUF2934 domain-containing protein n=1 Tax=Rhizobium sp. CFBP 13726 TaxID=2775296 RepID=UPI00177D4697|nr:DUF2934 domain-containing protein [Rhizobium sp. CFBP 13726]MBD8650994.1 DUF2934 domain-containing protein [Rhizobium sp. CFBP 13726]
MADDLYERVEKRAFEIWELEGRPEGAAQRHWDQAMDELAGDDDHETLQELIDEDDLRDEERADDRLGSPGDVEITTGENGSTSQVRSVEGP